MHAWPPQLAGQLGVSIPMILYVSPDQIMPLSGVLGTLLGLALMFWGKLLVALRKVSSLFSSKDPHKT